MEIPVTRSRYGLSELITVKLLVAKAAGNKW